MTPTIIVAFFVENFMTLLFSKTALRPVKYDNVTGRRFLILIWFHNISAANSTKAILGLQLWTINPFMVFKNYYQRKM